MRNVLAAIAAIAVMAGCTKQVRIEEETVRVVIDFSKYQKERFFITTGEYQGEYETIEAFTYTYFPEANYGYKKGSNIGRWFQDIIMPEEVLDDMYALSVERGANGVMQFKFRVINKIVDTKHNGDANLIGIEISGLMIKRK